ncbi:hypothetical protein CEP88_01420 [Roseobacter denitrificans]|uniref:Uncharacterized protein n=1 Tax=Roseobacter denitrificans (strain ATCC 33942 / OCh 114) TaxID=375451 RepID=Q167I2_ROSDO|nr:hypothetical protein [Roseobacter denitrificans]ABG31861.1 hypothetical protein RD1_2275 [Roseobacter denitrificans OCh 114]AVL51417.1 hypothetical protein CEP88_01420 [Roseobacter denitrificans]SFG42893.1 hypothetical protein SAMN05443635_11751 [Roseobacter denitrificans OCh 114]
MNRQFLPRHLVLACGALIMGLLLTATAVHADISRFVGSYVGAADVQSADGTSRPRDMSVKISQTKEGFRVYWKSTTYRKDGTAKEKAYTIDFVPSARPGVYASAMKRNVFGHAAQLDPMKGEPYVWGRIDGETLSVYSMYVTEDGGYEIQQFDRSLASRGLMLDFQTIRDGEIQRTVSTLLKRE